MAPIGRDGAVEAAVAAVAGVIEVEAAVAAAGLPGVRAARVRVLLAGDRADAAGDAVRAALDALRAVHGAAIRGSVAIEQRVAGVREAVPPRDAITAAGLEGAVAAGDELLFSGATRWDGRG